MMHYDMLYATLSFHIPDAVRVSANMKPSILDIGTMIASVTIVGSSEGRLKVSVGDALYFCPVEEDFHYLQGIIINLCLLYFMVSY